MNVRRFLTIIVNQRAHHRKYRFTLIFSSTNRERRINTVLVKYFINTISTTSDSFRMPFDQLITPDIVLFLFASGTTKLNEQFLEERKRTLNYLLMFSSSIFQSFTINGYSFTQPNLISTRYFSLFDRNNVSQVS